MPIGRHLLHVLLGCSLLLMCIVGYADEGFTRQPNPMRAPETARHAGHSPLAPTASSLPARVFDAYLRFFQSVISPVDGARSNMYPTGSAYARQVFKNYGALLGLILTTERLMHEGNEGQIALRIRKYGLWRIYDPVQANVWWWQSPQWVYTPRSRFGRRVAEDP